MRSKKASYIMYYIDVEHKYTEEVRKCSSQFPPQFHINKLIPMNSRHQITRKIYQKQVNS